MKKWNKRMILSMSLCLAVALSACGSDSSPDDVDEPDDIPELEGDARFEGWWVLSEEEKDSGGISLINVMQIFPEEGIWYSYNQFGGESDEMTCEIDGDYITLDLEITEAEYLLQDDQLVLPDTGEVHFVHVDDYEFMSVPSYDGKWYKNGDPEALTYYVLEGNTYTLYQSYDGEEYAAAEPAEWTPGNMEAFLATHDSVKDVTTIDMGFMQPTLYIDDTGLIGYTDDMFDYIFYAHESMVGSPEAALAQKKCELMSAQYQTEVGGDGTFKYLRFLPYGFDIWTYGADGTSIETEPFDGTWSGVWDMDENGVITLNYFDGTVEETSLADGTIAAVGFTFTAE